MNRLVALAGIPLLVLSFAPLASSAPVVGKETRTGDIYISGLSGYQSLNAAYSSIPKTVKKVANECGFITLTNSESSPIVGTNTLKLGNGTGFLVSSLPVQVAPKCTNGQLSDANPSPASILKTVEGDVIFTGLTDFAQYEISIDLPQTRAVKANTCGIAKLSSSGIYSNPTGTITITDKETNAAIATTDLSTITAVSGGPICRNGTALYTTDWPNP